MSGLKWWQGLGGAASVLVGAQQEKEKFDAMNGIKAGSITILSIVAIAVLVLNILLIVLAYKMFPNYKGLHAFMTFILGVFWLIPAMLYYLLVLKGYHMKGICITKHF
jgi:hypothetical protein